MENENQRVRFFDVGHGDSSVIYLNNGSLEKENVVIIDIVDSDKLLEELESHKIKVIDLIIISHSDEDHCRGVNDFLEKFMAVGVVKSICFNLDKRQPTNKMRLLCHCNVDEFDRKCCGDIEIATSNTAYEIRTEKENLSLLNHIACRE